MEAQSDKGRRGWHRYPVNIPARVNIAESSASGTLLDFSASGMRIALPGSGIMRVARGTIVHAGFALKQGRVRANAALVRARRVSEAIELGVVFSALNPAVHRGLVLAADEIAEPRPYSESEIAELSFLRLRERLRLQIDWCMANGLEGPEFFHALTRLEAGWRDLSQGRERLIGDNCEALANALSGRFNRLGLDDLCAETTRQVCDEVSRLVEFQPTQAVAS
ncbi:MAG: PilZ domain-containing protein [Pseudomonadota bacterium]